MKKDSFNKVKSVQTKNELSKMPSIIDAAIRELSVGKTFSLQIFANYVNLAL